MRVLVLAEGFSRGARATLGEPRLKHTNWLGEILPDDAEAGYLLARTLMLRSQPDIDVIWAANDAMALGALDAARTAGRAPGKDLFLGGIDLGYETLVAICEGSLTVSIGGHFLDGARAILLVHDHHRGLDFEPWKIRSPLVSATHENAGRCCRFFEERAWGTVDFTRFSRAGNPHAEPPGFSLDSLVDVAHLA